MPTEYFFLYLIYGTVFIWMGILSLQPREAVVSDLPVVRSLKYLGGFGITHGLSEWATMLVIASLYPESYLTVFVIKQILKAASFGFLIYFGLSLLPIGGRWKPLVPAILLAIWATGFGYLAYQYGAGYHLTNPMFNRVILRYCMGFPGGLLSGFALIWQARLMNIPAIAQKYRRLAYVFFLYGFLDGVFVRQADFFPANVINSQLFLQIFRIPIQTGKIFVGVAISVLLLAVIRTFSWEQRAKLSYLQKLRTGDEERRKLGIELHDSIIQGLYSAGLKVEYLLKNDVSDTSKTLLEEVKSDLNVLVTKTRDFIYSSTLKTIDFDSLGEKIRELIDTFNNNQNVKFSFHNSGSRGAPVQLQPEQSTQIYYIVQEAISNVVKHSRATEAVVFMGVSDVIQIKIKDNGIGFSEDNIVGSNSYGLQTMRARAKQIKGTLRIRSQKKGTLVELLVPLERKTNDAKN